LSSSFIFAKQQTNIFHICLEADNVSMQKLYRLLAFQANLLYMWYSYLFSFMS